MWSTVAAIVGLLAAGLSYWFKRSADKAPEKLVAANEDVKRLKKTIKQLKRQLERKTKVINYYRSRLNEERKRRLSDLDSAAAAARLREPAKADNPPG